MSNFWGALHNVLAVFSFFTVSDVRCILLAKRGVVLRSPFRKAFFLFHRPFFYDNWLSMTIHDRRFEGIPLVISFVVIYQ